MTTIKEIKQRVRLYVGARMTFDSQEDREELIKELIQTIAYGILPRD